MISQLQQHRRHAGLAHLPQGGGGAGIDLFRQGVNALEIPHEDVGGPLAVGAARVVEGDNAADGALPAAVRAAVGVEGQVEVVVPCIALTDGAGRRHLRRVAAEADGVGGEIRLHGIGDEVHEMLLAACAGDIRVIFLRGWTEIDAGHGHSPFLFAAL